MKFIKYFSHQTIIRNFSQRRSCIILGIETSCDDTACAVVNSDRYVLGECVVSQHKQILRLGGILPTIARDFHRLHIEQVVGNALNEAKLTLTDIDAIAVTMRPGLAMSLLVGANYGKRLSKLSNKSFIPIHHMEAHALTARLLNKDIEYPFLTFLISGGHCLLAVVHSADKFSLLGKSIDDAPGEAFDKIARRLKLHNLQKYKTFSGGAAVEDMAITGNPLAFTYSLPLSHYRDCNFSFSGLKSVTKASICREEKKYDIEPDGVLPNANDICASFQFIVTKHLCNRLQRAMQYIEYEDILPPENRLLVVSGGAACNNYIRRAFQIICREMNYNLYVPPSKYCSDNGIMIAWNGVEKYQANIDIYDPNTVDDLLIYPISPIGEDITEDVQQSRIVCKWIKIKELHNSTANPDTTGTSTDVNDNIEISNDLYNSKKELHENITNSNDVICTANDTNFSSDSTTSSNETLDDFSNTQNLLPLEDSSVR